MTCKRLRYWYGTWLIYMKSSINLKYSKMKKLVLIICAFAMGMIAEAQTVTINVTGNRNKQVSVDGRAYTISNTTSIAEQVVVINDLSTGQHTLQVTRSNTYNNRTSS